MKPDEQKINTLEELKENWQRLKKELSDHLQDEITSCELDNQFEEPIWDMPVVDSKSVMMLSPVVERLTGRKIKPEWIKPGGYEDVDEAIVHLMQQIETSFQPDNGVDKNDR